MNRKQLQASLALWRRRRAWNDKMRRNAHRLGHTEAAKKYGRRLAKCVTMINRRKRQLELARPVREKAMDNAKELLGVMEQGGNNVGPVVSKIIRAAGGAPGEPWCGDFVIYVYQLAGSKLVQRDWAAVRFMLTHGVYRTTNPRRGDIVRFEFDHTGLFDHWADAKGNKVAKDRATHIVTIEGNTGQVGAVSDSKTGGDGVYRKIRAKNLVTDYLRVNR